MGRVGSDKLRLFKEGKMTLQYVSNSEFEHEPQVRPMRLPATSRIIAPRSRLLQKSDFLFTSAAFRRSTVSEQSGCSTTSREVRCRFKPRRNIRWTTKSPTQRGDTGKEGRMALSIWDCLGCDEVMLCGMRMCLEKEGNHLDLCEIRMSLYCEPCPMPYYN
jgi:hypothetical protein